MRMLSIVHIIWVQKIYLRKAFKLFKLGDHDWNVADAHVYFNTNGLVSLLFHGALIHMINIVLDLLLVNINEIFILA